MSDRDTSVALLHRPRHERCIVASSEPSRLVCRPRVLRSLKWTVAMLTVCLIVGISLWVALCPSLKKRQKRLMDVLPQLQSCCESEGVAYWAEFGTLLGAVREKGIIPHDDDIDLGMMMSDFERLRPALSRYGLSLITYIPLPHLGNILKKHSYVKVGALDEKRPFPCLYAIDIFLYKQTDDGTIQPINGPTSLFDTSKIPSTDVDCALGETDFGDLKIKVLRNPESRLEHLYGQNWHIPKKQATHYQLLQIFIGTAVGILLLVLAVCVLGIVRTCAQSGKHLRRAHRHE